MSNVCFNKEQLNAIEKRNSSLMVSAAAGSGKTAVLVERIIRKITEEKVNINELLVVTFTNAAASGMKEKIKKAIKECIKKDKANAFLRRQLYLIDSANISTVHSFCLGLIKKYGYMLLENIPSKFTLLEETEKALMMQQIICDIINEYYEAGDEIFERLSESYSGIRSDEMLIKLILTLYSSLVSIPEYPLWIEKNVNALKNTEDFYNSDAAKSLFIHIKKVLEASVKKYEFALEFMAGDELLLAYEELFKEECMTLKSALLCDNLFDLLDCVERIQFDSLNSHRAKKGADTVIPQTVRKSVKSSIEKIQDTFSNSIIKAELTGNENIDIVFKLFEIILLFDKRFKEEKYEKGTLDFNDLEHLTITLLNDNGKLREEFHPLRDSFNEIMVDEYQDTNDVQESIFNLLKKEDNLFTVGDIKQSIYRFRYANPDLFIKRTNEYLKCDSGEVINLNANYRCHNNIINTVNCIFSFIMTEDIAKIDYKKSEMLVCKGDFSSITENKLASELKIALCDKDTEETLQSAEAKMLGRTIKNMVNDEEFIIEGRRVTYKDIVILVRSFNDKTLEFLNSLKREGIPAVYEDKTAFFETAEVKIIISLLKVLDNPYDDVSLISVLRNLFDYSEDELIDIRLIKEKGYFYEALLVSESKKDIKTVNYLKELKSFSLKYEINLLINKIYKDTFFVEKQMALVNGYKRKENLERLEEIAREYENTEFKGISSFISYVNKIIAGKKKIASPKLNDDTDAVRIMTIHKSKGLEFPIVIVAGMHKKFNNRELNENVIINSKLGIGYNIVNPEKQYKYKSVYKNILILNEERESTNEEIRVLYVALTRAKYKLIMSGALSKKDEWYLKYENALLNSDSSLSYIDFGEFNNYLDMVMPPLLRHRSLAQLVGNKWIKDYDFKLDFSVLDADNIISDENENKAFDISGDLSLSDTEFLEIDKKVGYKYNNLFGKIPKKISVSGLKDELNEDYNAKTGARTEIYAPDFRKESKITAAERGTLIHYVFERINLEDMKKAGNKLSVILQFIENNEYLKERLTLEDLRKLEAFFEHPLGIKMLRAKEVWREKDFLIRMNINEIYKEFKDVQTDEKIIIQGIMDCYFVDTKGEFYLIDYKYVNKTESQIKKAYSYQIELYREALSKARGVPKNEIKAYIWDVNRQTAIDF